jgi:hypothetical protein
MESHEDWTYISSREGDPRFDSIVVGYEQGTATPIHMQRSRAMEVYPKHARYLAGQDNPYRLPGIACGDDGPVKKPPVDNFVDRDGYGTTAKPPRKVSGLVSLQNEALTVDASKPASPSKEQIKYVDLKSLARLEGRDLFDDEDADWTNVDQPDPEATVAQSSFSDDSSDKAVGVLRSMSAKVKNVFKRPSIDKRRAGSVSVLSRRTSTYPHPQNLHPEIERKPAKKAHRRDADALKQDGISAPLAGMKHYPPEHSRVQADPIITGATELRGRNLFNPPDDPSAKGYKYPHALRPRPSKNKKKVSPPVKVEYPRQVKIVGHPDRCTQFEDFIDIDYIDLENHFEDESYGILKIEPPPPLRITKVSSSLDKPSHSRMVPDSPTLPHPAKVTSLGDWEMDEDYPTRKEDVIKEIDRQIEELDRSPVGTQETDEDDEEPRLVADTFIRDGHTSWRMTERPNGQTARSEAGKVSRDACEASILMEKLRRQRAGEMT